MKVLILLMSISIALMLTTCRGVLEPDFSAYNKLAISAQIDGNSHIVIVDCEDRSNYKIITGPEESARDPIYSPDKRYIIYGDAYGTTDAGHRIVLYDTYTGEKRDWPHPDFPPPARLSGSYIVWDLNSQGFYMSQVSMGIPVNIIYLNIETNELSTIADFILTGVFGIKDAATLIVLSSNTPLTDGPEGYYYMNTSGEFLGPVNNPQLRLEHDDNHLSTRLAIDIEYNPYLELFVFALVDSGVSGKAICITNLDGSYFELLSNGYRDAKPTLNPTDNVVYFERMQYTGSGFVDYPIMKVDITTKQVIDFFKANRIKGATEVKAPNF